MATRKREPRRPSSTASSRSSSSTLASSSSRRTTRFRCSSASSSARSSHPTSTSSSRYAWPGSSARRSPGSRCARPTGSHPSRRSRESVSASSNSDRSQSRLWKRELRPALADAGHRGRRHRGSRREGARAAREALRARDLPGPHPAGGRPGQPFPYISGLSLSLAVFAPTRSTGEERFARVKIPEGLPRFVEIRQAASTSRSSRSSPTSSRTVPGRDIVERAVFRVTRDADFEVSDDADDLLEAVETSCAAPLR